MADPLRYSTQWIDDEDIAAVVEALRSPWLTQGPRVDEFERALAARVGAAHAVAVSSGSAALHLVAAALRLGPGDVFLTSPITFVATANAARHLGAEVDFCDVRADTATMDPEALVARVAQHGGRVRVIAPVDFAGTPADLELIRGVADRTGAFLLEDGCHALGAEWRAGADWVPVGSGRGAHACVFSFHPVKSITTGEGGMIVTDDGELAARLRALRHHGIRRGAELGIDDPDPWYHEVHELGFNYRLTDFQCALGMRQLARLDLFLAGRRAVAAAYDAAFAGCDAIEVPGVPDDRRSARHLYPIRLRLERMRVTRRQVWDVLAAAGIAAQVHYIPVHLQPYYRGEGFRPGDFPIAEDHYRRTLSLPCHPALREADQRRVIDALLRAVGA